MRILFQGDSITDCHRCKDEAAVDLRLGMGYVLLCQAELTCEEPGRYEILNRGISGDRTTDLYARIKRDIINLKPDVLSILIGVNDVWREFEREDGVETERFEKVYNLLIEDVKAALPDIKIIILEPFLIPGSASEGFYGKFLSQVKEKADVAKRMAEKYGLVFVPLQEKFEEFAAIAGADKLSHDGVHPNATGHELIKNEWLKGFEKLIG